MSMETYWRLIGGPPQTDPLDRHVFACAIAVAERDRPLAVALGLSSDMLACLVRRHFPHAPELVEGCGDGLTPLGPEEPDLRALLSAHGSVPGPDADWLAHIIARRALEPNHLWQDLGLDSRDDLGRLMSGRFSKLAVLNDGRMRWKKFLYRKLCEQEGMSICKSPTCELCTDFKRCFDVESADPGTFPKVA